MIFNTRTCFHAATDVDAERPHTTNRIGDIIHA